MTRSFKIETETHIYTCWRFSPILSPKSHNLPVVKEPRSSSWLSTVIMCVSMYVCVDEKTGVACYSGVSQHMNCCHNVVYFATYPTYMLFVYESLATYTYRYNFPKVLRYTCLSYDV